MKHQKFLTEKQHEILGRLEAVLKEANDNNIGFVFDQSDCTLSAFNAENVNLMLCGRCGEEDDVPMDWDFASFVENFNADYFHSSYDKYYLSLEETK